MNIFEITLDVDKHGNHESVNMRQGDLMGTTISATLRDHDVPMEGGDYDAFFCMTLPDRKTYYRTEAEYADGVVSVVVDEQYAAQVPGSTNNAYFELWDGEELKYTTDSFVVRIKASAMDGKPAESYDSRVEEIMSEMREVIDEETVNEAARQEAEAAREAAESIRATTFETNEAAREATFTANEAERESTAAANEQARADLFTANEDERAETFSENEDERSQTFETNESDRSSTFASNEAERIATFSDNEDERSDTFSENEQSREDTFTDNEATRAATFLANESQRSSTFTANEARREAVYNDIIQYPKAEVETTSTGQILHVTWKNEGGEYSTDLTVNEATSIVVTGDTFSVPVDHDGVCTTGGVARFYFSGWVGSKRVPCSASLTSGPDSRFRVQFTNATSTAEGVVRVTYTAGTTYDDLVDVCTFTLSCNGKSYVHRISATAPKAGKNAGFGTVSASVTNAGDTPLVEVTTTGTDDAKNIDFAFSGIQGADGISPSVSITDSDSSHTVTITDSTGDHSYTVPTYADEEQTREDAWDALESTVLSATENANTAAASARAASDGTITDAKLSDEGIKSRFYRTFDTEYTAEAEGTILTVDDAYAAPPVDVTVYGQSTQLTTTGKNLFNSDNTPRGYYNNSGEFVASNGYVWWSVPVSEGDIIRYRNCQYCTMTHWLNGEYVNHSNQTAGADFTVPAGVDEIRGYSGTNTLGTAIVTKNNSDISYEPYTGEKPSPSPDYPQPIESVDALALEVHGKNLFDQSLMKDQAAWNIIKLYAPVGTTLTMSTNCDARVDATGLGCYFRQPNGSQGAATQVFVNHTITQTIGEQGFVEVVQRRVSGTDSFANYEWQIEVGSTATDYEPYVGTTVPIDLQGHELRSLPDGTRDELNLTYIGNGSTEGYGLYHAELVQRVGVGNLTISGDMTYTVGDSPNSAGLYNNIIRWSTQASFNTSGFGLMYMGSDGQNVPESLLMSPLGASNFPTSFSANTKAGVAVRSSKTVYIRSTTPIPRSDFDALVSQDDNALVIAPLSTPVTHDLGTVELPTLPSPATIFADGGSATPSLHMTYELPVETTSRGIVTDVMLEDTQMRSDVDHLLGQRITKTLLGTLLTAADAYAAPPIGAEVYGQSTQLTTTGKNLFDQSQITASTSASFLTVQLEAGVTYTTSTTKPSGSGGFDIRADGTNLSVNTAVYSGHPVTFTTDASGTGAITIRYYNGSGVPLSTYNYQIEAGTTATAYEPYTGGKPSPNPDYAQPIESVDALTLTLAGKNLFDKDNAILYNGYFDSVGHIRPNGSIRIVCIPVVGDMTYTISRGWTASTWGWEYDVLPVPGVDGTVGLQSHSIPNTSLSLTTQPTAKYICIQLGNITQIDYLAELTSIQLELGTTATVYEPYVDTSVPIDLQGHELRSLPNGTRDELTLTPEGTVWRETLTQRLGSTTTAATDGITGTVGVDVMSTTGEIADGPTVTYALATPVTHDLGTVTLPTNPAPDMTVWADGGSATPSLSLTYERDLRIVIANLEAAIADLATS